LIRIWERPTGVAGRTTGGDGKTDAAAGVLGGEKE
jgi:hypothetical protein